MDPLSQAVLGATAPQLAARHKHLASAGLLGFFSGMAADLDIFIRSSTDPLLFLEYHRQFTHSLVFIPIGGLLCALFFHLLLRRSMLSFQQKWLFCTLGYATHGLLDSCTSYGTQLFWPFSTERIGWNTISIIDPAFTLPLLVLVILAAAKKQRVFSVLALCWVFFYMGIGLLQQQRVESAAYALAKQRGHDILQLQVKPGFANMVLWKAIYETRSGNYYVDAIRAGSDLQVYEGEHVARLDLTRDFPWLNPDSQQAKDIERFRWFSQGFIAMNPQNPLQVIDVRYSIVPNTISPLWGIELSNTATPEQHARYVSDRSSSADNRELFWKMVFGSTPGKILVVEKH